MGVTTRDLGWLGGLVAADVRRLAALDPLLDPRAPTRAIIPGAGGTVLADGAGRVGALATVVQRDSVWTAPRVQALALARAPGSEADAEADEQAATAALGEVLDRWEEVLALDPEASAPATSASVTVPALDDEVVAPLVARHFGRSTVLAVRRVRAADARAASRAAGERPGERPGGRPVRVRVAGPDDLGAVVAHACAVHAGDRAYGFVPEVPDLERRLGSEVAGELGAAPGWTWVAEQDGAVVGVCQVEPPHRAGWITSAVTAAPAAYLGILHVDPEVRGAGVGRALVAAAHARGAEEGLVAMLLHHAAASPRSAPFWAREGYRPLLATWSRRPAVRAPADRGPSR